MKSLARAEDRDEIRSRLRALRPDHARRWGVMTVHQMVCHLGDSFEMALGRRPVAGTSGPLQRTIVKWVALYLPWRWPPGIRTSAELDQRLAHCTVPDQFDADLARVEALMGELPAPEAARRWPVHPVFGRLSAAAWLRWGYLHTDHHLRQFGL